MLLKKSKDHYLSEIEISQSRQTTRKRIKKVAPKKLEVDGKRLEGSGMRLNVDGTGLGSLIGLELFVVL